MKSNSSAKSGQLHPGWDTHIAADAPYSLCVTFEVLQGESDLHADVETALIELRAEIGTLPIELPGTS